jgi:vancomycin resistance protein VanW
MMYIEKKPINRSKLRLFMGKRCYTYKRYLQWYLTNKNYSKTIGEEKLEHLVFTHRTPLIRKLQNVDMYLQYNKITNLKLAVKKINGIIIKPGETFSYWKLIGKTTYNKGYLDGLILCPSGKFKPGVGGGLCQLSNLIYWMTVHTPLTVTERYRHSHDIFPDINRTQPFGSGATCVYNYMDLQIYNKTNNEYQLTIYLTDEMLVGEWLSSKPARFYYEVYEKDHSITPGLFGGGYIRNNMLYRKVYNMNDELLDDEYITENHAIMTYLPYLNGGEK